MHISHRLQRLTPLNLTTLVPAILAMALLMPARLAHAEVVITKDGLTSAEAASCVIDIDSLRDFAFTTDNPDVFIVKRSTATYSTTSLGESEVYGVYIWGIPQQGITTLSGSFELAWEGALLDNEGNRHDLHVRFSNIQVNWKYDPDVGAVSQQLLRVTDSAIRLIAEPEALIRWDSTANAYKSKFDNAWVNGVFYALGISCDVTFWNGDSSSLKYNLYAQDIDRPDRFTGNLHDSCAWGTSWAESFTPLSEFGTYHAEEGTTLDTDGTTIYGTRVTGGNEEQLSGFVTLGTMAGSEQPLSFTWLGSACSTRILQDWSYLLRTRVINGVGGSIYAKTGGGVEIKSNDTDTWNETGMVPRSDYLVTATPANGYHIIGMWVDDKAVSESELAAGAVRLSSVAQDHDVAVQFEKDDETTGGVRLLKSSADASVTDDNPCYSLEGAQYGVYTDEECTASAGMLTTNANGQSEILVLDPGTYYVKEAEAPIGYALDESVHEVTLAAGKTTTVELSDAPQGNQIDVVAQKVDADTDKAAPQGAATLKGAVFSVSYYAGYYESTELPASATRTWTLETDADGKAYLDGDHLVSGDDFYLFGGKPGLPLGTVAITETKAPEGYALPDAALQVQQISASSNDATIASFSIPSEASPTVADPIIRGGVSVKKTDKSGESVLAGATFSVTNTNDAAVIVGGESYGKGEVCLTVKSGADGIASTANDALPYGSYTISEAEAPAGYLLDSSWSEAFTITNDGELVDLTSNPAKNERLSATVTLKATKDFDGSSQGRRLERDMFTFELLDSTGKVIQTKTNDENGEVAFSTIAFDSQDAGKEFSYTIREVEGDDQEIVYDTHEEQVTVSVKLADDGTLTTHVQTDEDGIVFHNTTVPSVAMPFTGRGGLRLMVPCALTALVAGGTLAGRQGLKREKRRRRRR